MPPPIRYPLPTLLLLILIGLLSWKGEVWTRSLKGSIQSRWARLNPGPSIPSSTEPQVLAGPIVRKLLLLREDVPVSDQPGRSATNSIRLRMFLDIYDQWPLDGRPDFYRVGNRNPIGWIRAEDALEWSTRLVVQPSDEPEGVASVPVLSWRGTSIEVGAWEVGQPWRKLAPKRTLSANALRPDALQVFLSRQELLTLIRKTSTDLSDEAALDLRLRAILGRLYDVRSLPKDDLEAALAYLPSQVRPPVPPVLSILQINEQLARFNENWTAEASWGGLTFQPVPLSYLP